MPGISLIGDSRNAARNRPTSLPAEARSLSRMLRLLNSPETAANVLEQSLATLLQVASSSHEAAALEKAKSLVHQTIHQMRAAGWENLADRYAEYNMALAVESVLQDPESFVGKKSVGNGTPKKPNQSKNNNVPKTVALSEQSQEGDSITDASSVVATGRNAHTLEVNDADLSASPFSLSTGSKSNEQQQPTTSHLIAAKRQLALVSDSSTVEADEASQEDDFIKESTEETEESGNTDGAIQTHSAGKLWSILLESLHLQIASRTTRVWGRKKIYEVYELARPVEDIGSPRELPLLRERLEMECRTSLDGVLDDGACRVYVTMQPLLPNIAAADSSSSKQPQQQALFVQISLGQLLDLQDERNRSVSGEKKKKAEKEFVALMVPGSTLFCLTASRAASRSRFCPFILTVLENVLTETTNTASASTLFGARTAGGKAKKPKLTLNDLAVKRFGDLSGTEPCDLLRAARAAAEGEAVGRYALMAEKDQSNPIADLHTATTANLIGCANPSQSKRIEVGTALPGNSNVAWAAAEIATESNGTAALLGANRSAKNLWVDHTVQQQYSRKRARQEALGRAQDCPSLQRLCWKWTGKTTAASACWEKGNINVLEEQKKWPATDFKCAVTMKGENVLQGLQALMEAGLVEGPLPDFIRDAPAMGSSTIRVNNGSFAPADAPFEEV